MAASYELPFGKDKAWGSDWARVTNALLGGWSSSGIFQTRTGFPVTVSDARGSSLQAVLARAPGLHRRLEAGNQSIDNWIDINASHGGARARGATARWAWPGRPATPTST